MEVRRALPSGGQRAILDRMEIKALAKDILRRKAERARALTLDERLTAGAALFAEQLLLLRDMIAGLHPEWTEAEVDAELRRRLDVMRRIRERGFYSHSQPTYQDLRKLS